MEGPSAAHAAGSHEAATVGQVVDVRTHGWAHGGEAVARLPDGRACFVADALPDEVVRMRVTRSARRWARATVVEVLEASPDRVEPPCPHVDACGGCQLQHIAPARQLELKARVLREQLQRVGGLTDLPPIVVRRPLGPWPEGYRAWARMAIAATGRPGFRRRRSSQVEPIERCLLLGERVQALADQLGSDGRPGSEVLLVAGDEAGLVLRDDAAPADRAVTLTVGPQAFRVSAGAFFQSGPGAALTLAQAVVAAAEVAPGDHVVDLYAGGGLLSCFLARTGTSVLAVEADPRAAADAVANTAGLPVEVVAASVETVVDDLGRPDVIVLDPPRRGAGQALTERLARLGARRIVYVSCDPPALARDAAVLAAEGYALVAVDGLDLFAHTAHVEAVATFDPTARAGGATNGARA